MPVTSIINGVDLERLSQTIAADFDADQLAELESLTRFSPVRDVVSNPVPIAIDVARACAARTMPAPAVPAARASCPFETMPCVTELRTAHTADLGASTTSAI